MEIRGSLPEGCETPRPLNGDDVTNMGSQPENSTPCTPVNDTRNNVSQSGDSTPCNPVNDATNRGYQSGNSTNLPPVNNGTIRGPDVILENGVTETGKIKKMTRKRTINKKKV